MTKLRFARVFGLCAAFAFAAGGAQAHVTAARTQDGATKSTPASQASGAKKQGASAADGKPGAAGATKKGQAAAAAATPQVREINEDGLKALLEEHSKGGRRLLINFWATWCTPCREEFPELVSVDKEFAAAEDFEFITVSLDDVSELGTTVPKFLSDMRAGAMPAYLLNAADQEAAIAVIDKNWQGNLPATFLFGPDGRILFRHMGRVHREQLRKAIKASGKTVTSNE
jgi:thiol-disulfide isomerase/thioredoxin